MSVLLHVAVIWSTVEFDWPFPRLDTKLASTHPLPLRHELTSKQHNVPFNSWTNLVVAACFSSVLWSRSSLSSITHVDATRSRFCTSSSQASQHLRNGDDTTNTFNIESSV